MRSRLKSYIILFFAGIQLILGFGQSVAQQKAMFSQYMFNGLVINPAYSSIDDALNITALARKQWVGFEGAPTTQTFSIHSPIRESNTSAGFIFMRDQIGEVISETGASGTLAHRVEVGDETYFSLGLSGGLSKYAGNYSQTGSASAAIDPVFADQNSLRMNLGFGMMFFSKKFYAGFSSPYFYYRDLKNVSTSAASYKPHYILQGGYLTDISEDIKFKPNLLIKYVNGSPVQMDLNANFLIRESIWIGASLRSMDSLDLLAEMQLTPNIQLGYSYDFTTSKLAAVEKGSHEIMLNFRLSNRGKSSTLPKCYF